MSPVLLQSWTDFVTNAALFSLILLTRQSFLEDKVNRVAVENLKNRQLCLKYAEGQWMVNDDAKDMKQKQESYARGWLQRTDVEDERVRFPTVNTD